MDSKLFEYFNTTNQTSPHFEKHLNFAKPEMPIRCEKITLLEHNERCDYATNDPSCYEHVFIINYNKYFYCWCDENDLLRIVCIGILIVLCALFFWLLYKTTSQFFVPALTEISKMLNLTEYVAGLTVMALGNSAPDIFACTMGLNAASRHVYSDTMSVSLFVSVFVSSLVMWVTPFTTDGTFFLRDVGFVLLYVTYIDFSVKTSDGFIGIYRAISMASIYVIYITVVIADYIMQQRIDKKWREQQERTSEELINFDKQALPYSAYESRWNINLTHTFRSPNKRLFRQFFQVFDTLDREKFKSKWTVIKLWALIKILPLIALRLLIPQMNFKDSPYSWSKLLCCIQISLTPTVMALSFIQKLRLAQTINILGINVPIVAIVLTLTLPLSIWTFVHSRTDMVPEWYQYITVLSVVSSILMLYFVSNELVALLETVGITLDRSHTFIGCTLYTLGTGMSDLMTNCSMAKQGFPRMGFSACFGVTVFKTFSGICIPIIYGILSSESRYYELTEGTIGESTSTFLIISLIFMILYGISTNFMLRRTGGLVGIILYIVFIIYSFSSEFEITHSFGSDHSLDRSHFDESYGD